MPPSRLPPPLDATAASAAVARPTGSLRQSKRGGRQHIAVDPAASASAEYGTFSARLWAPARNVCSQITRAFQSGCGPPVRIAGGCAVSTDVQARSGQIFFEYLYSI
jgi:hypothetical protein